MIYAHRIDADGYFVEDMFVDSLDDMLIEVLCPEGLYRPRWNGTEWVEGETQANINEALAGNIRAKRDRLLKESDWTQLPDAPVDSTVWAVYRQDLRDIPQQVGFPADVSWPAEP